MDRLYVVVDDDLPSGLKIAQAIHAQRAFADQFPSLEAHWFRESNNIVCLQTAELPSLAERLEARGLKLARFHEPDLNDHMTAFCVEPQAARWLSSLPLARG